MTNLNLSLVVIPDKHNPRRGVALLENHTRVFNCALGKGGVSPDKREGDGATPLGSFELRQAFYRPDREAQPKTNLNLHALTPEDGWCDDPASGDYNKQVRLPYAQRHERLWREDRLYDLIVVVGYNDAPVVPGRGSAIFLHLAREDYAPTEGCIAFKREDLLTILAKLGPGSRVVIEP
jgi:L,D-peptidoglycan transpeptidase YkuD (ErfK/YbiS/YcfS/YnhG family)